MPKPNDDLSALFRSLRPDESVFQENTTSSVRDAEQRWPLFKAVAPQKPQDTPALSAQERQNWVSQEKPVVGVRKPALSLPGLSDKMSSGLGKMSGQAVRNTAAVKPATRWESEEHVSDGATAQSLSQSPVRTKTVLAEPVPLTTTPVNRAPTVTKVLSEVPVADSHSRTGLDVFNVKHSSKATSLVSVHIPEVPERALPVIDRGSDSLKSVFGRLQGKPEVEVKLPVKRSSFLDRLGKR